MPDDDPYERIEAALREVRTECRKAALVYAFVDATAVFLATNLAIGVLGIEAVPADVAVPPALADRLAEPMGLQTPVSVPGSAVAASPVAALACAVELWLRLRRPLVEQFEAVNPVAAESLRTARDTVAKDRQSPMVARLYEDALADLAESSGAALVDAKRVLAPALLVAVLALATQGTAVVDLALFSGGTPAPDRGGGDLNRTYTGLRDADRVLGDAESVSAGDRELNASVESSGAGREEEAEPQFPQTGPGGSTGTGVSVEGQQAGFAAPERVEAAELVREYNRRIREESTD